MKNNTYPVKSGFLGMGLVVDYERLFELQSSKEERIQETNKITKTETDGKQYSKRLNRKMLKR